MGILMQGRIRQVSFLGVVTVSVALKYMMAPMYCRNEHSLHNVESLCDVRYGVAVTCCA